ncbi:hypothetical protein DCO57_17545 [Labrenzia sp. 011]|nr:hypothetical protein DCO57_17545 [Labrenzia sp. 011]
MFTTIHLRDNRPIPKAPKISKPLVIDEFGECLISLFAGARWMVEYLDLAGPALFWRQTRAHWFLHLF